MIITFNELRRIKDKLPSGSSQRIADELGIDVETVRNYLAVVIWMPRRVPVFISSRAPMVVWLRWTILLSLMLLCAFSTRINS